MRSEQWIWKAAFFPFSLGCFLWCSILLRTALSAIHFSQIARNASQTTHIWMLMTVCIVKHDKNCIHCDSMKLVFLFMNTYSRIVIFATLHWMNSGFFLAEARHKLNCCSEMQESTIFVIDYAKFEHFDYRNLAFCNRFFHPIPCDWFQTTILFEIVESTSNRLLDRLPYANWLLWV